MAFETLIVWLLLMLPGYAVVRRVVPESNRGGLLGAVALSYLGTLTLLSPVSIVGYLLSLPLACVSAACAVLVLAAAIDLTRCRAWPQLGKTALAAVGFELVIVLADCVLGARTGSIMSADATVHLGRIRFLTDHGLSNGDIYVAGDYVFSLYHTNLLHALFAAVGHLSGEDHLGTWFAALPWAKLLTASGGYFLAWCVFQSRWAAWAAAVFTVGAQGPVSFMLYPNKLAPFWLLAMAIGFAVLAARDTRWWHVTAIAAATLVSAQVHALYAGFAMVLLVPVFGVVLMGRMRKRERVRALTCAMLALGAGTPFLLASVFLRPASPQPQQIRSASAEEGAPARNAAVASFGNDFLVLENGQALRDPRRGFGSMRGLRWLWLLAGAIFALRTERRGETAVILGVIAIAAAVLFVPPLCQAAVRVLGAGWMLVRLEVVLFLVFPTLTVGLAGYYVERLTPRPEVRTIVSVLALLFGATITQQQYPYDWRTYTNLASLPADRRHGSLWALRNLGRFLQKRLPRGETVLVEPHLGMTLVAAYDCRLVMPDQASIGVPSGELRRRHVREMLWHNDSVRREKLLKQYPLRYVFVREPPQWLTQSARRLGSTQQGELWELTSQR